MWELSTFFAEAKHDSASLKEEELAHFFKDQATPRRDWRTGVEWELFGVDPETGAAMPYSGPRGVEATLRYLSEHFGWAVHREQDRLIALDRDGHVVGLEPGGQLELAAAPCRTLGALADALARFCGELAEAGQALGIAWISVGIHPTAQRRDLEWVPKTRYRIMRERFERTGALGLDMMALTAAVQVSLDYESERDAIEKLSLALRATLPASAAFAHSGFEQGRPNGFAARRVLIWGGTDPARCGFLGAFWRGEGSFAAYLQFVLDMPMLFVVREGRWIPVENCTFRRFLREGYQGLRAVRDDFELHLSTAFPEVRLKRFLEIRGQDAPPGPMLLAAPAFWKGLLYDARARRAGLQLLEPLARLDPEAVRAEVARQGLAAQIAGRSAREWMTELCALARQGLGRDCRERAMDDEARFLVPLERSLELGRAPSDDLSALWRERGTLKAVVEHLTVSRRGVA